MASVQALHAAVRCTPRQAQTWYHDLQVAQLTYPVLLARYEAILTAYSQHIQRSTEGKDRLQLDETLCVLEVCSAMKIAPAVADAAAQSSSQRQVTFCVCGDW